MWRRQWERKIVKNRAHFPSDEAATNFLYLAGPRFARYFEQVLHKGQFKPDGGEDLSGIVSWCPGPESNRHGLAANGF